MEFKNSRFLMAAVAAALACFALAAFVGDSEAADAAPVAQIAQAPKPTETKAVIDTVEWNPGGVLGFNVRLGQAPIVSLLANGQLVFAPGYTPTPAAVAFWMAVADANPYTVAYDGFIEENQILRREIDALKAQLSKGKKAKK